ncbi:MAG: hypothetical protein DRQ39_10135 [Gammaproteobacteria bacterium]|nr:MAG: hypothetical protein DRQ39_10135 [Gammaproteobacteria bacterium]RLD67000.1 MAG: hypothetical protein DRI98_12995 [Bacteroidota bacterium]
MKVHKIIETNGDNEMIDSGKAIENITEASGGESITVTPNDPVLMRYRKELSAINIRTGTIRSDVDNLQTQVFGDLESYDNDIYPENEQHTGEMGALQDTIELLATNVAALESDIKRFVSFFQ